LNGSWLPYKSSTMDGWMKWKDAKYDGRLFILMISQMASIPSLLH